MIFQRASVLAAVSLLSVLASPVALADTGCTNGIEIPDDFDGADWPAMYRLTSPDPETPLQPNFDGIVDPKILAKAGVTYRYIDPTGFDYPNATAAKPWIPLQNATNDPLVEKLRDENDYQYADIFVGSKFYATFWDEHSHAAATIRYMLDGTGYFDLRDVDDSWVRIPVSAGDWFEWPAGINHRFTVDENAYIQAMRLYKGSESSQWASVSRLSVAGNDTARNEYVDTYLCGSDPDADVAEDTTMDYAGEIYDNITATFESSANATMDSIGEIYDNITATFESSANATMDSIGEKYDDIAATFDSSANATKDYAGEIYDDIAATFDAPTVDTPTADAPGPNVGATFSNNDPDCVEDCGKDGTFESSANGLGGVQMMVAVSVASSLVSIMLA